MLMIPYEKLVPGMVVYHGNLKFSTKKIRPTNKLEIRPGIITNKISSLVEVSRPEFLLKIPIWRYGYDLGSSLFSTKEEAIEAWNSVVYNALDLLSLQKETREKELIEIEKWINQI